MVLDQDHQLRNFNDDVINIISSVKRGGYGILLSYRNIDIDVLNQCTKSHNSSCMNYYICGIIIHCKNMMVIKHLIMHGNNINNYINDIMFALCYNHNVGDLIEITKYLKINIKNYERICWIAYICHNTDPSRRYMSNNKYHDFITFFVQNGFTLDTILTNDNGKIITVRNRCKWDVNFYKTCIKGYFDDSDTSDIDKYHTNKSLCIII